MATLIIGAGLAGLAAALELQERGEDFQILEQAPRAGGVVGSVRRDGFLLEQGPRTVANHAPSLGRLIAASGLGDACQQSQDEAKRRYVFSQGELHAVPQDLSQLWGSRLLSFSAKMRLLAEPFIGRGGTPDETVEDFVTRRFGREASERLADPMCAGIYGGTPGRLGIDALGVARDLEREHGSLLRGMARRAKERKQRGEPGHALLSFPEGLQQLTDSLTTHFADQLLLRTRVLSIQPTPTGFEVHCEGESVAGEQRMLCADRVILAVPAPIAASLIKPLDAEAAGSLQSIRHVPIASVALGYPAEAVEHPLDGFGLLCCSDSPMPPEAPILGVLFSSSIFEGRAPEGRVLLEVMIGGDRDPEALDQEDSALLERATRAAEGLLGARGTPVFHAVTRWAPVLPQYATSHGQLVEGIEERVGDLGALALAGNYLRGVGVEGAAASGIAAVERLLGKAPSDPQADGLG